MLEDVLKTIFGSGSPIVVPSLLLVLQLGVYWYVKDLEPFAILLRAIETSAFGGLTATAAAVAQPTSRIHGVFGASSVYLVLVMFLIWAGLVISATRLLKASGQGASPANGQKVVAIVLAYHGNPTSASSSPGPTRRTETQRRSQR